MNKKIIFPLLLVVILLTSFYFYSKFHVAPSINLKKLNLVSLTNEPINFENFRGKKILLSFGASWCPNCLEEMRDLSDIQNSQLNDVEIIIISDEPIETIQNFKDKKGYNFTFLKMIPSFNSIGINSIPTSYIVNTNLMVMQETVGYVNWKDISTATHLKKLME